MMAPATVTLSGLRFDQLSFLARPAGTERKIQRRLWVKLIRSILSPNVITQLALSSKIC